MEYDEARLLEETLLGETVRVATHLDDQAIDAGEGQGHPNTQHIDDPVPIGEVTQNRVDHRT